MNEIIQLAQYGLVDHTLTSSIMRGAVGGFFMISGFNKLFNPGRHNSLRNNLIKNNIPDIKFMEWWVPFWEFVSGALLALGIFTAFNAAVLIIICIVACCCESRDKVNNYHPINFGDKIADYLYLPEVLYVLMLLQYI